MSDLYYILLLFVAIFAEVKGFESNSERTAYKEELKRPSEEWSASTKGRTAIGLFYILLTIAGIASDQWPVFLLLFTLGMASYRMSRFAPYRYADTIASLALVIAAVINHFHFQTNVLNLILR
jgi:hypothetical protein